MGTSAAWVFWVTVSWVCLFSSVFPYTLPQRWLCFPLRVVLLWEAKGRKSTNTMPRGRYTAWTGASGRINVFGWRLAVLSRNTTIRWLRYWDTVGFSSFTRVEFILELCFSLSGSNHLAWRGQRRICCSSHLWPSLSDNQDNLDPR